MNFLTYSAAVNSNASTSSAISPRRILGLTICIIVAVAALVAVPWLRENYFGGYEPSEGDIVFHSMPLNPLTVAIEGVTQSRISHCGVVLREGGRWMVIEAMGPGVIKVPLWMWIWRGRERHLLVMRLDPLWSPRIPQFVSALQRHLGKPYDLRYRMDDEAIYCSELVYKGFREVTGEGLGRLERLGDLNWKPHEDFIARVENGPVPVDREMITPVSLSRAPELRLVFNRGY
ncbi:peptidase [Verrucomicrobia bacterium LW23]|nr:peptidase [Verrucomicrobia bacterium LW23]